MYVGVGNMAWSQDGGKGCFLILAHSTYLLCADCQHQPEEVLSFPHENRHLSLSPPQLNYVLSSQLPPASQEGLA